MIWKGALVSAYGLIALAAVPLHGQQVSGVVLDRVTGAPIGGATVHLLSTVHELLGVTTTDREGTYVLTSPEYGEVLLLAEVTGYTSVVSPTMALSADTQTQYEFRVATLMGVPASAPEPDAESLAHALALLCEARYDVRTEGILVGVVRDSISKLPLPEVRTRLEWTDDGRVRAREVVTGDDGSFVFCEAPVGEGRQLIAEIAGVVAFGEKFEVNPGMIKRKDVSLNLSSANRPGDVLGSVTDFETGEPVMGAEVRLRGTRFSSASGAFGEFAFADVPWGVYFLEVEHIAYGLQARPLRVLGDQAHEVDFKLASEAMELDELTVSVRSRDWFGGMRDFRERKSRGFGYFLDRAAIERRGAGTVVDLLREIPGVHIEMARSPENEPGRTTTTALYFRGCWRFRSDGAREFTPPMFYVNGVKQARLDLSRGDLDTVAAQDIEAIEIYRGPAEMPADFGGSDAACGAIAVWTKRG